MVANYLFSWPYFLSDEKNFHRPLLICVNFITIVSNEKNISLVEQYSNKSKKDLVLALLHISILVLRFVGLAAWPGLDSGPVSNQNWLPQFCQVDFPHFDCNWMQLNC